MGNLWTSLVGSSCRARNKSQLSPEESLRKENHAKSTSLFFETLFYVTFFILLVIMSYNNRDLRAFGLKLSISNRLDVSDNFNKIIKPSQVWTWAHTSLVSFLHPDFNDSRIKVNFEGDKLVSDMVSYKIGPTRLRQHRARDETCSLHAVMSQLALRCSVPWSSADRDWDSYSTNWTTERQGEKNDKTIEVQGEKVDKKQLVDMTQNPCGINRIVKTDGALEQEAKTQNSYSYLDLQNTSSAWIYRAWADIGGLPITGNLGLYPPGGYVVDIDGSRNDTISALTYLQSSNWVDNRTRVLLVELTLYSPNVNLFVKVTAVFEFPQAEVVMGYLHIHPFRLFIYLGNFPILHMVFDYLVYVVTVWFVFRQTDKICHERLQYFKKFWNIIELINLLCSVSAVILHVGRYIISQDVSKEAFKTTGQFYNFQTLAMWDELFGFLVAFVCFMATLQLLNLLRFNKRMSVLGATMMRSAGDLLSFLLVFVVMMFAFLCFCYLTFGAFMKSYRTTVDAFESLLLISLGKLEYGLMNDVSRVLTPAFIFVYVLFVVFILLNMLVSILTDSFAEVREDINSQPNDYELIEYMVSTTTFFMWRFSPFRGLWAGLCKAGLISESEPDSVRRPKPPPSGQVPSAGSSDEQTTSAMLSNRQVTLTTASREQTAPVTPSNRQMTPTAPPGEQTPSTASSDKQVTPSAPPGEQTPSVASSDKQMTPTAPPGEGTPSARSSDKQMTPTAPPGEQTPSLTSSNRQTTLTRPLAEKTPSGTSLSTQNTFTPPPSVQDTPTPTPSKQKSMLHRTTKMNYSHQVSGDEDTFNKTFLLLEAQLGKITEKINSFMKMEGVKDFTPNLETFNKIIRKSLEDIDNTSFDDDVLSKPKSKRKVSFQSDVKVGKSKLTFPELDLDTEDSFCNYGDIRMSPSRDQLVPEFGNMDSRDATVYHNTVNYESSFKGANKGEMYKHPLEVHVEVCDEFPDCSSESSLDLSEFTYSFHGDSEISHEMSDAGSELFKTPDKHTNPRFYFAQTHV